MNKQPEFGDRYSLIWLAMGSEIVGEVRNYAGDRKGYRTITIVLDDAEMQRRSLRFLAASWDSGAPKITVTKDFMVLQQSLREAGIWHEVGHIHHEHHLNNELSDQAQVREARIGAIKTGHVVWHEAEADRFAVERVGKDAVVEFLSHALATRPTGGKLGWNDFGRQELELRIGAVQAL